MARPDRTPAARRPLGAGALTASLVLTLILLAGCLGAPSTDAGPATGDGPAPPPDGAAVVHRPGPDGDAGAELDARQALAALAPGVPLPVGEARYTGSWGFEPTLGVTSDGAIFFSSLTAVTDTMDEVLVMRSTDEGASWTDVTPKIADTVTVPPRSFDPYVHVDEDTDRVFVVDLGPLACSTVSTSDDGGETWVSNPVACGGHPAAPHDHQSLWTSRPTTLVPAGYDNVVHYCVNRLVDTACAFSLDGGLTFGPLAPVSWGEGREDCGGLHAHGTAGPDGTVYLPAGKCGTPMVAISEDDGLTWTPVVISEDVQTGGGAQADGHEVAFAVDEAGNAYAFWITPDNLPVLAVSTDGGRTWGEPFVASPPAVSYASFPTLAAGADGRIAVAYVGTEADVGGAGDDAFEDADVTWNAYMAVVLNATGEPVLSTVRANDPADPIGRKDCGLNRCYGAEGGGSLGDFIDVVIDREGRPWAAFVDVCTRSCAEPDGEDNDFGLGFAATLAEGPALRGELAALPALTPLANDGGEGGDGDGNGTAPAAPNLAWWHGPVSP